MKADKLDVKNCCKSQEMKSLKFVACIESPKNDKWVISYFHTICARLELNMDYILRYLSLKSIQNDLVISIAEEKCKEVLK